MIKNYESIIEYIKENRRFIYWPVAAFTAIALAFCFLKPTWWEASQAILVRDEASLSSGRIGKFESVDAMQTAQETLYEVARHHNVLTAALKTSGPYRGKAGKSWPTDKQVDQFRRNVSVSSPNGTKFGRTEVLYLSVRGRTKDRAYELTDNVCAELIQRMKQLRIERYDSVIEETGRAVEIARQELADASAKLTKLEREVGPDIAELRVMVDQGQGNGNVRISINNIESELRAARGEFARKKDQYQELVAAINDPRKLITMPNTILDNQPTLKRLKEGLVAAQLNTANQMGGKSARHPDVQKALAAEQGIRGQLYRELKSAVGTLNSEVRLASNKVETLIRQQKAVGGRLGGLANIRTKYNNLTNQVRQKSEFIKTAESSLAMARSNRASAESSSLIQRIDSPVVSSRPAGLGRRYIVLGGVFAGLMTGLGLLFIMMPVDGESGKAYEGGNRRLGWGRRGTDGFIPTSGRRETDRMLGLILWSKRNWLNLPVLLDPLSHRKSHFDQRSRGDKLGIGKKTRWLR
jgi:uncharacterized protein involved in exopolysaccharide biosynthesis